jgi:DNA-directed RNA polymerase specialized sigma24 family protein
MTITIPPELLHQLCDPDCPEKAKQAIEKLFPYCQPNALAIVCSCVGLDAGDARDAVQNAWILAYTKRGSFCANSERNFKGWFIAIAKNCGRLFHRERKKWGNIDVIPDNFDLSDPSDPFDDDYFESLDEESEPKIDIRQFCVDQLREHRLKWFEALESLVLGEEAEQELMRKYQIDAAELYRWRWRGKQFVTNCADGGAS